MSSNRLDHVLIITGRLCEEPIRAIMKGTGANVMSVPTDVAALMTSHQVADMLEGRDLSKYDCVLLPGMFREDVEELAGCIGIPVFLGPVHFVDLPFVLTELEQDQLSAKEPADLILRESLGRRTEEVYAQACRVPEELPEGAIVLGRGRARVPLMQGTPPRVIGEVVDAPRKSYYSILNEAKAMVCAGANIVDIGMLPGEDNPDFIAATIPQIRKEIRVPISIDTMRPRELLSAADAGIDLVLSLCGQTIELAHSLDAPFVLLPLESIDGRPPRTARDRIALLSAYSHRVEGSAYVLDPILDPIGQGFGESIAAYADLRTSFPRRPSLMGVGNITEMADADSVGMNALLAAIACEHGIQLLLTTENSPKTRGSVGELATACRMMYYATTRGVPPKNLGIDLLRLKEKRVLESPVALPSVRIRAKSGEQALPDVSGDPSFRIALRDGRIHVIVRQDRELDIIGRSAAEIGSELRRRALLPSQYHSLYLGGELAKAEAALLSRRSYVQDLPLFPGWDVCEEDQD